MRVRRHLRGSVRSGQAMWRCATLGAIAIVLLALAACGGANETVARPPSNSPALPAVTAAGGNAPAAARAPGSSTGSDASSTSSVPATVPAPSEAKIIHNGTVALAVKDVPAALQASGGIATDLGGYVSSSSTQGAGDSVHGDLTLRIPAEQYDNAMIRLRGLGTRVLRETSSAQDVTDQYVDLTARQKTLQLTVNQLQALLAQAKTVDDTLKVQTQLTSVQSDLERVTGQINLLDNRAAFSTITISLDLAASANLPAGWSFGRTVADAWAGSLRGLQGFINLLITVIVGGWWLLVLLAGIIVGVRWLRRRLPARPHPVTPVAPAGFAGPPLVYAPYPAPYGPSQGVVPPQSAPAMTPDPAAQAAAPPPHPDTTATM